MQSISHAIAKLFVNSIFCQLTASLFEKLRVYATFFKFSLSLFYPILKKIILHRDKCKTSSFKSSFTSFINCFIENSYAPRGPCLVWTLEVYQVFPILIQIFIMEHVLLKYKLNKRCLIEINNNYNGRINYFNFIIDVVRCGIEMCYRPLRNRMAIYLL